MDMLSRDISKFHLLTSDEEKSLTEEYAATKNLKIRNLIVNHNLRLVKKIANEYGGSSDVMAEGMIGLIQGIDRFDPSRGVKLSTYVSDWIRAYILNFAVKNARLVKVGTTKAQRKLFFNLNKEKAKLEAEGIEFTPEVIATRLNVKESEVVEMDIRINYDYSLDKVTNSGSDGGETTLLDMIASETMSAEDALASVEAADQLQKSMEVFKSSLKIKERVVFDQRMIEDKTLQEVGDGLDLTKERIRQIEVKLKDKLKKFCENNQITV